MTSIMFNSIPKPEYAQFYSFERKKDAKGGFFSWFYVRKMNNINKKSFTWQKCEQRKEITSHFVTENTAKLLVICKLFIKLQKCSLMC